MFLAMVLLHWTKALLGPFHDPIVTFSIQDYVIDKCVKLLTTVRVHHFQFNMKKKSTNDLVAPGETELCKPPLCSP